MTDNSFDLYAGMFGDLLPDPPVDSSAVTGCDTSGVSQNQIGKLSKPKVDRMKMIHQLRIEGMATWCP